MAFPRVHGSLPRRVQTGTGDFALNIREWVEKAKERANYVVQKTAMDLLSSVIQMSPVGNPELWAANAGAVYARETYNLFAEALGAPKVSARGLKAKFTLKAGKGYVGGRFKGNWTVTIGSPSVGETGRIDPSGNETRIAGNVAAGYAKAGDVIYIMNNVPYAQRLEYGWSKQAPAGMVRVTVARFQAIVNASVAAAKAGLP